MGNTEPIYRLFSRDNLMASHFNSSGDERIHKHLAPRADMTLQSVVPNLYALQQKFQREVTRVLATRKKLMVYDKVSIWHQ